MKKKMSLSKNNQLTLLTMELDVGFFMEKCFGIKPDPWQLELLKNTPDHTLLLCCRQAGKSTISAITALYNATFKPGSLILVVAKARRQALELFKKILEGLHGIVATGLVSVKYSTQSSLELSNGSRIVAIPGKQDTIRGYSKVAFLLLDEAAFIPDDVYAAVRPMLAVSKGKIIAMSTPYGKRGWFYRAWENRKKEGNFWFTVSVTANDCPRISDEFIENEISETGEWRVRQEYFCDFVDAEDQLFSYDDLMDAITEDITAWRGGPPICLV